MIFPYSAATMGAFLLFSQPTGVESFSCTIQSNIIAFPSSHAAITRARKRHVFAASTNRDISHPDAQNRRLHSSKTKDTVRPTARFVAIAALSPGSSKKENVDSLAFAARRLEQDERYQRLEPRDRAFARLLVATVERRLGQIDGVLKRCVDKYPPKGKHASLLQATLRIGVAQLLFLNTPPFAANHDTVQVLRISHRLSKNSFPVPEPMIRFVNGVLRKLSTPAVVSEEEVGAGGHEDDSKHTTLYGHELLKQTSPDDNIAPWLLERWERDWGESRARLIREEMMPFNNNLVTSRIDVTTKYSLTSLMESPNPISHQNSRAMLEKIQQDFGDDCILLPQGSLRIGSSLTGDITQWPGYHDGTWWVQDASSTLPALVLTRALSNSRDGEDLSSLHVMDMCAAPGGKTSQLLSAGFGRVTAIEASERRSRRLVENLSRLNLSERCHVIVGDGQNYRPPEGDDHIHGILLDVPCSATGTGARRPDVLRRSSDLKGLLQIQELLANHCVDKILSEGGILVYATCSILKEESEDQVTKLIARVKQNSKHASMTTLPIHPSEVPGFESAIAENGWLRVLPGVLEGDLRSTDGFFVARLIKGVS